MAEKNYIKKLLMPNGQGVEQTFYIKDGEAADTPISDTFILNLFNPDAQTAQTEEEEGEVN